MHLSPLRLSHCNRYHYRLCCIQLLKQSSIYCINFAPIILSVFQYDFSTCLTCLRSFYISLMKYWHNTREGHHLILTSNIAQFFPFSLADSFTSHCCWSARYKRSYNFSILFNSCLKTLLIAFSFETIKRLDIYWNCVDSD